MIAAQVWTWWMGVFMFAFMGIGSVLAISIGYVKQVSAQRYPQGRRQREQQL